MSQTRIIWFAIVFSTVVYAGMIYTLTADQVTGTFDEALQRPLVLPLYAAGIGFFFAGLVGFRSLKERNLRAGMIICLALFEACALMGLLAALIAQDWRLFLPAWAVTLLGFVKEWPSE